MNNIDTFSANSLKILDRDKDEFILKYEKNLLLNSGNTQAKAGQNLHTYLCYYLKGFDTSKIENAFSENDKNFIEKIKNLDEVNRLKNAANKQIEAPFYVKCGKFYLTGRFDAVLSEPLQTEIFDWKTLNLPKNPNSDIQTVVYLYSAAKLFKTENLSITYISLTKGESATVHFDNTQNYRETIEKIISKYKNAC